MPTTNPTSLTRLPDPYAVAVRGAYVILIFLIWAIMVAGIPDAFARARVTVHIPRRPRTPDVPAVPATRPFEALACAIPLISAPWDDDDGLVPPPPADAQTRRRAPPAREHDRAAGRVTVHGHTDVVVAPDAYWASLERIALAHLLLFEDGVLERDAFFAPEGAGSPE